jgi:uncharacterized protein YbaP (TraB family)
MRTRLAAGIAMLGLLMSLPLIAQQASAPIEELETILVTGEHPGPGLWRISKGDHVMWVLGTYAPLPEDMTWRSQDVEARIAESKEVILPATVEVDDGIGFFRMVTLIPAMLKSVRLPEKKTLRDVLPAATWRKWQFLRNKYLGGESYADRMRPAMAASMLRDGAYKKDRLTEKPAIESAVKSAAKKHRVRVHSLRDVEPKMKTKIKRKDLHTAITDIGGMADLECFTHDLDDLEADLEQLRQRANAWARGDVEALRHLHEQPDIVSACDEVLEASIMSEDATNAARMQQIAAEYDAAEARGKLKAEEEWIAAARKALERNRSTVALLPIREVVSADGYVAKLKELGYEVEAPGASVQ